MRVVVVVAGFYYGGRSHRYLDELEVPAPHVQAWLDGGHVRAAEEFTSDTRDVRDLVDGFMANGR